MVAQRVDGRLRTRARGDEGDDPLDEALVGHADHDRVEHVGVRLERGLHLFGEHLLAAGVDRHRPAAEQGDGAVGLDGGEVARHDPPHAVGVVQERGRGLALVLVVAEGDVAPLGEPPDLARAGRHRAECVAEHRRVLAHGESGAPRRARRCPSPSRWRPFPRRRSCRSPSRRGAPPAAAPSPPWRGWPRPSRSPRATRGRGAICPSRASASGRAMASPTTITELARSRATMRQISSAS